MKIICVIPFLCVVLVNTLPTVPSIRTSFAGFEIINLKPPKMQLIPSGSTSVPISREKLEPVEKNAKDANSTTTHEENSTFPFISTFHASILIFILVTTALICCIAMLFLKISKMSKQVARYEHQVSMFAKVVEHLDRMSDYENLRWTPVCENKNETIFEMHTAFV